VTTQNGSAASDDRIAVRRLGHIGLAARDLERSVAFYTELLGMEVSDRLIYPAGARVAEGVWLRCDTLHHCISIFRMPDIDEPDNGSGRFGLHHLAFEVGSFDDLVRASRAATRAGLPVEGRLGGPGWQLRIYTEDPDRNTVELFWDQDHIGWDGLSRPFIPIEYGIDVESFDLDAYLARKQDHAAPSPVT
jgi:catechol 2,3-dioxygenase-like lactoylglutathione lyase family enzyme